MKMHKIRIAALVAILSFSISLCAQDSDKIDSVSILSALKAIKKKHEETQKVEDSKLVQQIYATAANTAAAINFYQEAVRVTRFEGQNRETTQFNEWRRKGRDADHMKDRSWQEALRLHLYYLAITLQDSLGVATKDLLPQLLNYTKQLASEQDSVAGQDEWLNHPITESIFVRWLLLSDQLANLENWEMAPGNLDEIYQKTILPELRKQKDARLLDYWDIRIQMEATQAGNSQRAFDIDKFNQITKPKLLWNRASEMVVLGQKSKAAAEMMALIKGNPNHPDVGDWIGKLEKLAQGGSNQTSSE